MNRSKEITKYQTAKINPWREDGYDYRADVKYGMHYISGNNQPYFSITVDIYSKNSKGGGWRDSGGGCCHDLIKKRKKSLLPLIDFHLCDQDGLPMHYLENGYYWYKENLETFRSYVRLSGDEIIPEVSKVELPTALDENGTEVDLSEKQKERIIESHRKEFIIGWLKTREEKLKREFDETMAKFEVEYITQEEIEALNASQ